MTRFMTMHVRFDQVEVFKLRHYSNDVTLLTKKSYQIDNFELDRQTKRRSKKRFHRSDLYREWVITQGLIVDDETDDGTSFFDDISSPSPNDRLAMEKIQEAASRKNPKVKGIQIVDDETDDKCLHDIISSLSAIDRLAMEKIQKAGEKRTKRRQRRRRGQFFFHTQKRRSCSRAVRKGSVSIAV
jgi:hypothetical protein